MFHAFTSLAIKMLTLSWFLLFLVFTAKANSEPLQTLKLNKQAPIILLAIPDHRGFPFWLRVKNFAQIVSKNLNIDLRIITFDANDHAHLHYTKTIKSVIDNQYKPDFIISMFWQNGQSNLLNYADQIKIPLITINSSFQQNSETNPKPRETHPYWYAHISPDDQQTGFKLAKFLLSSYGNKQGNLFALTGDNFSAPSINRVAGLKQALSSHPNIQLTKITYTDWTSFDGRRKLNKYLKGPHETFNILWTAGDFIALGAIHAAEQHLGSVDSLLIGSVDWNKDSISLIKKNKLDASLGGHFIEAGKALILAYDLLHGHDFKDELGTTIITEMALMTAENIETVAQGINFARWKNLDFKHLSKTYNNNRTEYQLDIESLLQFKLD